MKAITESSGKAKEYSRYSCNSYYGCGIRCNYNTNGGCYAAAMAVRFGWFKSIEDFQNNPRPKEGIIEALRKDAEKLKKKEPGAFVLLSFMTDPYQPINEKYQLARQAIEILHENGLGVNILTKGKITDWDLLAKNPHLSKVGVTITGASQEYEPNAGGHFTRVGNLCMAKELKIKAWASMEPVINPEICLGYIKNHHYAIDEFKIGKWNYSKEADKIDWYKFTNDAVELLEKLGCEYYIKDDLKGYLR